MLRALINDPEHWQLRAEEARAIAEEMTDPEARRQMLQVADSYEEIARRAEARALTTGIRKTPPHGSVDRDGAGGAALPKRA